MIRVPLIERAIPNSKFQLLLQVSETEGGISHHCLNHPAGKAEALDLIGLGLLTIDMDLPNHKSLRIKITELGQRAVDEARHFLANMKVNFDFKG